MFLKILKCIIAWSLFVHRKGGIRWIDVYHLYLGLVALNPHQCLSPLEKEDLTVYLFRSGFNSQRSMNPLLSVSKKLKTSLATSITCFFCFIHYFCIYCLFFVYAFCEKMKNIILCIIIKWYLFILNKHNSYIIEKYDI